MADRGAEKLLAKGDKPRYIGRAHEPLMLRIKQ